MIRSRRLTRVVAATSVAAAALVVASSPASAVTAQRFPGIDRYETASMIATAAFPNGSARAYLATGENFADALAATPAAAGEGAPILLTLRDRLPDRTKGALHQLGVKEVRILGGTAAVSDAVIAELHATGLGVIRIAGPDRYATAAAVSARSFPSGSQVAYIAMGDLFADALAGGAAAGVTGHPQLLVSPTGLPEATAAEIDRLRPTEIVLVGRAATSTTLRDAVRARTQATITLVGGNDAYVTAAAMARRTFPHTTARAVIATGAAFPDGLAGGVLAAVWKAPLLLTHPTSPSEAPLDAMWKFEPQHFAVLGGTAAVSDDTMSLFANWSMVGPNPTGNPPSGTGPESEGGGYRILFVNPDGTNVRFNPCRTIPWVFNPSGAPSTALADVTAAVQRLAAGTGMTFAYEGTTSEAAVYDRSPYQPSRYGQRWAPILVGWADNAGLDWPGAFGVGQALTANRGGADVIVSGTLLFNSDPTYQVKPGSINLAMHELGHIVGLDHPSSFHTVMQAPGLQPNGEWRAGDLAGLRAVGAPAGCLQDPTPA